MADKNNKAAETDVIDPLAEQEPQGASGAANTGAPYGQGYPPHTADSHPAEDEPAPAEVYGATPAMTEVPEPEAAPKAAKAKE